MKEQTLETLVVLGRAPGVAGLKSRLSRELGELEAARLEAAFLADTMTLAAAWRRRATPAEARHVALYVAEGSDDALLLELCALSGARVVLHSGADAGEQLRNALTDELDRGAARVFALGSHAPSLPVHLLDEGMRAMQFHDAVVGPTFDGGAWGLGFRRDADGSLDRERTLMAALLDKIPWGQAGLLGQTLERLHKAGHSLHLLPYWFDVGEPSDLPRLKTNLRYQELRGSGAGALTRSALQQQPPPSVPIPSPHPRTPRRA